MFTIKKTDFSVVICAFPMQENIEEFKKRQYHLHLSDIKDIVVNYALPPWHGGSFKITLTVP